MKLTPEVLLYAYREGVFPMARARDSQRVFWVNPMERGIIPLDGFHISRSLARRMRRGGFEVTIDQDFAAVVNACAERKETWINAELRALYLALFASGHAHSVEIREQGELAGGVFGVCVGAAFCGESMFSHRRDGSKLALAWLVDRLRLGGFTLFDTQFTTSHLESLGAVEIPRDEYFRRLDDATAREADFLGPPIGTAQEIIQRNTQTS